MVRISQALPFLIVALFLSFPIAMGLANTLMVLLLLGWLVCGRYRERWATIRANPIILLALLLYGIILIGTLYTPAPTEDVILHIKKYSKLVVVVIVFSLLSDPIWQRRCMHAFALAMAFVLVSTWLNIWFLLPWSASQTLGWRESHHVFGDYITQNVMMSFFVLLCLVYAYKQTNFRKRIFWVFIAVMAAMSITHLSQGRTGYVLLAVALLTFVLSTLKGKSFWAAIIVLIFGLSAAFTSSQLISKRFEQARVEFQKRDLNNQSSIGHRLYNYKTTIELIREKPLFGWGTGAYHTETCRVVGDPEKCTIFSWHPHNQYLFFGADHGMLGIFSYVALLISMVWFALKDKELESRVLLLGLAVLLATDSLFNSPLWSSRESHFFLFMMALLAARSSSSMHSESI
jgi:O-antigen ligase